MTRDPDGIMTSLAEAGYLADDATATVAFLGDALGKPLLVEGPAGVGKTELAKALATVHGARLVRLQCYEGLDEAKALYEWNYTKQLLRVQTAAAVPDGHGAVAADDPGATTTWSALREDIFSADYLLARPLLDALTATEPTLLLIDEVDKVDFEFEALLLEILSDFQVSIPELGTVVAGRRPWVVLTSNATRELSEALKRRCLYLHLDYPDIDRERAIVDARLPGIDAELADQLVRMVRSLRQLDLRKPPAVSETLDWAASLLALGVTRVDAATARATLSALLKHHTDVERALEHLALPESA